MSRLRPSLLTAAMLVALTQWPYAVAWLRPPPGLAFLGTFYYPDDFYNYLSYAQQAAAGAFRFQNKANLDAHAPALVNLEWWLVGRVAVALGGRLLLAYRLFAVLVSVGFVLVTDLWLRRLALPESHRLPALLLVATGGGLGGLLFAWFGAPLEQCLDLYVGLFPFLELLVNPHFMAGTALLLAALWLWDRGAGLRDWLAVTVVGTSLALVRPYDFVLLVAIRTLVVLATARPRQWPLKLAPLLGLGPVSAYLYWLFYRNPAFASYAKAPYVFPQPLEFLGALGPALLLAAWGVARPMAGAARGARDHLVAWAGVGLLVILLRPVHFSLQFLVGIGFPLLALAALALARFRPEVTLVAAASLATTLLVAVNNLLTPSALWFTRVENQEMVSALKERCQPGDMLFAPPDIGLFAFGVTSCQSFLSHRIAPDYDQKLAELRRFGAGSRPERRAILGRAGITLLVLPGDAGSSPTAWLGPASGFTREAVVGGNRLSLYRRR